jgi:hypothetical protein
MWVVLVMKLLDQNGRNPQLIVAPVSGLPASRERGAQIRYATRAEWNGVMK